MDQGINSARATADSNAVQLRKQHLQDMRSLIEDYTTQKIEIARERDAALAEKERTERERDEVKAALASEIQRTKQLQQSLESAKVEHRDAKAYRKNSQKAWREEKEKIEKKTKMFKNKLALTTASLEKRIEQAGQREEDERKDKEGLKRLNKELISQSHQVQRNASKAKAEHEQWRLQYSTALSEKIDLLRQYGVSHQ
jgi:chromosome segregation ATPase